MKRKYSFLSIIFLGLCFFEEPAQAQGQEQNQEQAQEQGQPAANQPPAPKEDKNTVRTQIKIGESASPEKLLASEQENRKYGRGWRIAGWAILGVGYAASVVTAILTGDDKYDKYHLIPLAGSLVQGIHYIGEGLDGGGFYGLWGLMLSGMQLTGVGMLITGYVKKYNYSVALSPVGPMGTAGLSVHGSFL